MGTHSRRPTVALALLALILPLLVAAQEVEAGDEITIVRDTYGVPHVYADTAEAVAYGAGYALAQDRLWQMHVFRHIGRGRLSDILGPVVVETDRTVRFFTYTEDERRRRLETYPEHIQRGLEAFAAGINAWIDRANADPSKLPFEFTAYGEAPVEPWTVTDSVALQDVLILAFGSGGGNELEYAALAARLVQRYGQQGLAMFDDLIRVDDPDDTVTIPEDLDWAATPTGARVEEVEAERRLTPDARLSLATEPAQAPAGSVSTAPVVDRAALGTAAQLSLVPDPQAALEQARPRLDGLERLQAMFSFGSNAQIVGPSRSETANSLQTGGPQVGYLVPQWLADFGLHGGGLDATGMTFAGAGPAVLIGRGNGYAWTTTTGASDLTDTYVERLHPDDPRRYRFDGEWEPMDCRTETYTFRGVPFESEEVCRTRHGPVVAFDEANDVAYALRYAWFDREIQTIEGFFGFNETRSLEDYATAANLLASNHNMFYSDDRGHTGYWHPGNHPVRPDGVDLRLPQDGTGGSEWQGLRPIQELPHAVDPDRGWLVNWNNAPAAGWARERTWPARDNVDDLTTAYSDGRIPDPRGDGGVVDPDGAWDFHDLSANLRYAAMRDHLATWYRSALPGGDDLDSELAREALQVVTSWDGFLLDRDADGSYDDAGTTIVRRWIQHMHGAAFGDDLGEDAGVARTDGELWHVVSPDSTLDLRHDWLDGEDRGAFTARTFEAAVAALADEHGGEDPGEWRSPSRTQSYQRLNADLAGDLVRDAACASVMCEGPADPREDSGMPGDVPEHIAMDRGTYNHVIHYLDAPAGDGGLGASRVKAGSVVPPGQNGFIDQAGREGAHYQDQLPLYVRWLYKPMPLTFEQAWRQRGSTETLVHPG